jgi:hypothetical protein
MDLHHLEGIIGIKPAVEEITPGVQLLSIPLLLSIALEQPGIGDHRMLLKCALKRVARRTQQHESRPDGLYLLQLGPLQFNSGPKPICFLNPCDSVVERTFPVFIDLLNIRD